MLQLPTFTCKSKLEGCIHSVPAFLFLSAEFLLNVSAGDGTLIEHLSPNRYPPIEQFDISALSCVINTNIDFEKIVPYFYISRDPSYALAIIIEYMRRTLNQIKLAQMCSILGKN